MLRIGGTIGILGGGQLGRMMAMSAANLGFRCIGYAPPGDNVAADVCTEFFANGWDDNAALESFAAKCDVITWEFENVPLAAIDALPSARLHPPRGALETAQDRLNEKRFVVELGGRTAPFCAVESRADLDSAIEQIGMPGILKTCRDGYDGKGQWRLANAGDVEALDLPDVPTVYEGFVEFDAEFSVILARGQDGAIRFWDSTRNEHEHGILARAVLPPGDLIAEHLDEARALAKQVADALEYVGVLTLEFFATEQGPVFNEMAPRVHNSGHWTIEGAATSQFENHIRAVAGLPLGGTSSVADEVEMRNIIGKPAEGALALLDDPSAHLHLYGKADAKDGRKMGHVTYVHE
ncbi:5-(carboxyamino)imidazole ribonucleotide synthase [Erythrobacter sp. W53]|uniref:5-(carboxyamino)imidazole ribonucleotide synthase n=1 Tax=Erythrobacter sp. W53 TaxID=3425947 RepID=UPI003D768BB7